MNLIQHLRTAAYPNTDTPVIAFLGDSVTHGAFECVEEGVGCVFDFDGVYHEVLRRRLLEINPWLPVSIINAGVAGDNAPAALSRLERDVITHRPHICVVNFGLNDLGEPQETYVAAMREIFTRLRAADISPILLTPNMLNTYVHPDTVEKFKDYAAVTAQWQNAGRMDACVDAARALAARMGVPVADAYARWKQMEAEGEDITLLLSNYINHPTRALHDIFADVLLETLDREV